MTTPAPPLNDAAQQAALLDKLPVGITVIDLQGRILYYNDTCARLVDRQPEHLGKDIRSCHKKGGSVAAIDRILDDIRTGRKQDVYYEAERRGKTLAVTISPYEVNGKLVGAIQSIFIKRT